VSHFSIFKGKYIDCKLLAVPTRNNSKLTLRNLLEGKAVGAKIVGLNLQKLLESKVKIDSHESNLAIREANCHEQVQSPHGQH